jgi:hypothetical protein
MDNIAKRKAIFIGELMRQTFDQGKSITASELARAVAERFLMHPVPSESMVYAWVSWLRKQGKLPLLISDKNGYHRAKNREEALQYMGQLEARIWGLRGKHGQMQGDLLGI